MARIVLTGFSLLLVVACAPLPSAHETDRVRSRARTQAGETVRVVRFTVKPDMRVAFEDFFWSSLKPAAQRAASNQADPIGSFRLLVPESLSRNGFYTYYVLIDPIGGSIPTGEAMRDFVRSAFPGEEGQRRIQRWMSSMVLGDDAPVGEDFVEADLSANEPPAR